MFKYYKYFFMLFLVLTSCTNKVILNKPKENKNNQIPIPSNVIYSANHIEVYNTNHLRPLIKKWMNKESIINVAHFGDSHIQLGWQIATLRERLQSVKGNAGRGMIFPYAIAKTYSQEDYSSTFSGTWKSSNSIYHPPKIPLGISGFVATTREKYAEVKFKFKKTISSNNVKATILFKTMGNYKITLASGFSIKTISTPNKLIPQSVDIELDSVDQELILAIETSDENAEFSLYGISLTNSKAPGIVYHNLGVGGATYSALLQQELFNQQFPIINADLVILDWGTNDLIYKNEISDDLEWTIHQTIKKVKDANPQAVILLTSVQESRFRGKDITISDAYSHLIRKIAKQENVLFYDWYTISGGHSSVQKWKEMGFASKDGIHLNAKGYRARGKLLSDAIIEMLNKER